MSKTIKISRVEHIRLRLRRGDKKKIASILDISPVWVSRVIMGKGVSEPVLRAAESLIREREQQTN